MAAARRQPRAVVVARDNCVGKETTEADAAVANVVAYRDDGGVTSEAPAATTGGGRVGWSPQCMEDLHCARACWPAHARGRAQQPARPAAAAATATEV